MRKQAKQFLCRAIDATSLNVSQGYDSVWRGTYHDLDWKIVGDLSSFKSLDKPSAKRLYQYEQIDRETDAMMRICQTSCWADSEISHHEYDSGEDDSEYLESDVYSKGKFRIPVIEACNEDSSRDDAEEGNRCENSMACDERLIAL